MLSLKCLVLIIIILLIILTISVINYSYFINKNIKYFGVNNNNYIDKSSVGGRGVFAAKSYKPTEIIEICPTIVDNGIVLDRTKLKDYVFKYDEFNNLVCFGNGSLYSHNDKPNTAYKIKTIDGEPYIIFFAIKNINKDDEIFVSYSKKWWNDRQDRIKKIDV